MNKRFDVSKLTLTTFNPDEFNKAAGTTPVTPLQPPSTKGDDVVPSGRTTLSLRKVMGVVTAATSAPSPLPSPPRPLSPPVGVLPSIPEISPTPPLPIPVITPQPLPLVTALIAPLVIPISEQTPPAAIADFVPDAIPLIADSVPEVIPVAVPQQVSEISAMLQVKAVKSPKKSPSDKDEKDSVQLNVRVPKGVKDMFLITCEKNNANPSKVLRNFMRAYCGHFILFLIVAASACSAAQPSDTSYSTDQILSYFFTKTFDLQSNIPDFKSSIGARHTLWQTGSPDNSTSPTDLANTRLEAKIEIPIFDYSYMRGRDKEKIALRASVMKLLSSILSAQKIVNLLEVRCGAARNRIEYTKTQTQLKLANKTDVFPMEDAFYNSESQLYEAQSQLEQRIIDLALLAGEEWQTAYGLIIKWDGKLFVVDRK